MTVSGERGQPGPRSSSALIPKISERDHHYNAISAKYTLVEYGDFECSDCSAAFHVVKELLRDLGEDFCYVFRNFPNTDLHPNARIAAEAAEAAEMQGKFWLMHDRLYERQGGLSPPTIRELAREMSLDMHRFDKDLQSGEPGRRVDADRAAAARAGVHETPTFLVNGRIQSTVYEYDALFRALTRERRPT